MKTIFGTLLVALVGLGTAQAQTASDSPAPLPTPANTLAKVRSGQNKPVSEMNADTLRVKTNQKKVAAATDKNQKLPSETEAPKVVVRKKD